MTKHARLSGTITTTVRYMRRIFGWTRVFIHLDDGRDVHVDLASSQTQELEQTFPNPDTLAGYPISVTEAYGAFHHPELPAPSAKHATQPRTTTKPPREEKADDARKVHLIFLSDSKDGAPLGDPTLFARYNGLAEGEIRPARKMEPGHYLVLLTAAHAKALHESVNNDDHETSCEVLSL